MRHWKLLLLSPMLGCASFNAAACYTVYDRSDRVVYQSEKAPVDMSRPLHETLSERFPGGHMIFGGDVECRVISSVAAGSGARNMATASPLFTNESSARAMHVRHIPLPGGIALVQPRDAVMAPGLTILPADTTAVAARRAGRDTVITEWREPPMTVESLDRSRDATRAMGAGPAPRR